MNTLVSTESNQKALFEEDYLRRTLGNIALVPDYALTELVANAWDAGATEVRIELPENDGGEVVVEDNGTGMTPEHFRNRWMKLGYNRLKHQGDRAEFPPGVQAGQRRAFGRNGLGRHGMLCFGELYTVESWRDGEGGRYVVATAEGEQPFKLLREQNFERDGHGTKLVAKSNKGVASVDSIREILAARFLHDPSFQVVVNGESIPFDEHKGRLNSETVTVEGVTLEIHYFDSSKSARTMRQHGVAFWLGGRLVGEPSWTLGEHVLADGRTAIARRHTVVVETNDLFDDVLADWSGFKKTPRVASVAKAVAEKVSAFLAEVGKSRVEEKKDTVFSRHRKDIDDLSTLAKTELASFVNEVTANYPAIQEDGLSVAVQALLNLEKSRSGKELLQKLALMTDEDVEGLNRLLEDWTIRDALTVLDEIDRRLSVVAALERLSSDPSVDELKTLHPLVTQARWLFGPEYDSSFYSSNQTLRNAVEQVFKKRATPDSFINQRKRPDLMILKDATLSATGVDRWSSETGLTQFSRILIIELKKGGSTIGRSELSQAEGYIEDIIHSGLIDGSPDIQAFVVGHKVGSKTSMVRKVGESEYGRIDGCTFTQLVRTAEARLFRLKDSLKERFDELDDDQILQRAFRQGALKL